MNDYFSSNVPVKEPKIAVVEKARKKATNTMTGWFIRNSNGIFTILLLLTASVVLFISTIVFDENPFTKREFTTSIIMLSVCSYLLFINGFRSGEKEYLTWLERKETGIKVNQSVQNELVAMRDEAGLNHIVFPFEKERNE